MPLDSRLARVSPALSAPKLMVECVATIVGPKKGRVIEASILIVVLIILVTIITNSSPLQADSSISDRLAGQPRRRQSQATLLSHKQNLITGSANTPLTSPYNQFYLTNNVNSPHNGKHQLASARTISRPRCALGHDVSNLISKLN